MAKNITKLKHRFPLKQLRKTLKLTFSHWPVIVLVALTIIISFLNYTPGTILTGWDNLHPEFAPLINLKRSLFAVWQEYQSLGLLGGMAHAADLPKDLLVWLLSFSPFPLFSFFRYSWTFLMLTIGPLGAYFLIDRVLLRNKFGKATVRFAAFFGALFYLLNLSTLQTFFTPFDSFTSFYGFLPWLVLVFLIYLRSPSLKNGFLLFILSLISSPAYYTETMFVVLILFLLPFLGEHIHSGKKRLHDLANAVKALVLLALANLYWLLPVIFFVITGSYITGISRINLIASPETYSRNLQFSDLGDLALLKGFWFNYQDLSGQNHFDYLMQAWRAQLNTVSVTVVGYLIFALVITGLVYALKKKFAYTRSFLSVWLICYFFLTSGAIVINSKIPLIGELFRSPFTKFSIPLSLAYAFFFSVGCVFLLDIFSFLHSRLTYLITLFTVALSLVIFVSPFFSGNLISPSLRPVLPEEYRQLFSFFRDQNPATRIANFPQSDFWGWLYYNWGYRGSGFLWYGVKQPILDRAFDVWSLSSQTYYEQINAALYSEDWDKFDSLIKKYAVNWILVDHHVIPPDSTVDLKDTALENHLSDSSAYTLAKNINNDILVFKTSFSDPDFISISPKTVSFTPFSPPSLRPNTISRLTQNSIDLPAIALDNTRGLSLSLPSLTDTEKLIPVSIFYQKAYGTVTIKLIPQVPHIGLNGQDISPGPQPTYISLPVRSDINSLILQVNKDYFELQLPAEISEFTGYYPLTSAYLPSKGSFPIALYDGTIETALDLTPNLTNAQPYQCFTDKPDRKIEKIVNGPDISLLGTDVVGCLSASLPSQTGNGVFSINYSYSSPTFTPANINITDLNLGSEDNTQPLEPFAKPHFTRQFARAGLLPQQLNLILEANESKSIQEINYTNIHVYLHPLLSGSLTTLHQIPALNRVLDQNYNQLLVSLPVVDSNLDIVQAPTSNQLLPEGRNCDQLNSGPVSKTTGKNGFVYQATNSIECDYLNLRQLPHDLNYLLSFDYRYQSGLPMTVCLENYSSHRCDVYERLLNTNQVQTLIDPVRNDSEGPGYTLHLLNTSIGKQTTKNTLKNLSIHPFPLKYLDGITVSSTSSANATTNAVTTHPAEFIYTVKGTTPSDFLLNLYQSSSPYWLALPVPANALNQPLLTTILSLPYYLLTSPHLARFDTGANWYNSYRLPKGDFDLIIFYLPQYLEFIGLAFLGLTFTSFLLFFLLKPIKNRLAKTKR